jgi:hypothetical protein
MGIDKEAVLALLKSADDAIERQSWVSVQPYELRELVTVWLRVAALYERTSGTLYGIEQDVAGALLFGRAPSDGQRT